MIQRITILLFIILLATDAHSQQTQFSLSTDINFLRSFKKEQRFGAVGQSVQAHFHFTPKNELYVWVSYYSNGKFTNRVQATAKAATIVPTQINYTNAALMKFKQISTGWKKYLKGASNAEDKYNLYAYAGFGLVLGRIENAHSIKLDTTKYNVPVLSGKANFKKLTIDLGLGGEVPLGADIYFYLEGRCWVPSAYYPSKYIFVTEKATLVAMLNAGIRILFE